MIKCEICGEEALDNGLCEKHQGKANSELSLIENPNQENIAYALWKEFQGGVGYEQDKG